MNARYVQKGESIDYRPETDVKFQTIIPFGGFVGITRLDIRAGELGAVAVTGVFESPKANEAIDVGDAVYWDTENDVATKEQTGIYLGLAVANAQASADFVYYLLNAGATGGSAGSAGTAIADLGDLTNDSEYMGVLKEKVNSILGALRSAGIIAAG